MNAIGYIRISTKDQSQYSLEYQERNVREYCTRNGLKLLEVFKDDGESSYTFDRPDFLKLEAFIKKNKSLTHMIIFDHDRFSRNLAEALLKIKELQDKFNIKVLATTDSFDTDFSDPTVFMMRAFKYMMAESELHRIRQRTRAGFLQGALNGRYLNKAPYGYINSRDDQDKPVLKIDEQKAFIVRMIFKEYNRGTNVFEIRDIVKPYGYKQKGRSAVTRILSNPVYAGLIKIPAHKGVKESIGKALHPPIVSEMAYYSAQKRLNGYKRKGTSINEIVPLKGVLQCDDCGNFLSAGNSRSKTGKYHWYYVCSKCRENFPATKLHDQMNKMLDLFSFFQERIDWYVEKLSEEIGIMFHDKGEKIARIERALRNVNDRIDAIDEKYLTEPTISKATYARSVEKLRSEQINLMGQLQDLNTDQDDHWVRLKELMPKMHDLRGLYEVMDLYSKQTFLKLCFNGFLSYKNGKFRTPHLNAVFAHNIDQLQQTGLLEIENGTDISIQSRSYHVRDSNSLKCLFALDCLQLLL